MRFTLPPLFVGGSLGREHFRSFSTATHGGTTLRRVAAVDFATLRPPQPRSYATHPPSSAQLHSLRAPSVARPKSGIWHCYAEPSVYVRCGQSPPPCLLPACSLLQNITKLCSKEVGRVRLSGLAAPLPLLPSLNSVSLSGGACSSPQSEKPITDTPWLLTIFVAPFAHCMCNKQTGCKGSKSFLIVALWRLPFALQELHIVSAATTRSPALLTI